MSQEHQHPTFDPTPVTELAAGEPHTPPWLTAVGAMLFAAAAVWAMTGEAEPGKPGAASASTAAAAAPPVRVAPPRPAPAPGGSVDPAALDRMRQQFERLRRAGKLDPIGGRR